MCYSFLYALLSFRKILSENCPNTKFSLVRIFPHFSVFSPNAGKYRPEKTPYLDTFHAVNLFLEVQKIAHMYHFSIKQFELLEETSCSSLFHK